MSLLLNEGRGPGDKGHGGEGWNFGTLCLLHWQDLPSGIPGPKTWCKEDLSSVKEDQDRKHLSKLNLTESHTGRTGHGTPGVAAPALSGGKLLKQVNLEATPKHMKGKVTGASQHGQTEKKSCLTDLVTLMEEYWMLFTGADGHSGVTTGINTGTNTVYHPH